MPRDELDSRDRVPLDFDEMRLRFDRVRGLREAYTAARADLARDVELLRQRTAYMDALLATSIRPLDASRAVSPPPEASGPAVEPDSTATPSPVPTPLPTPTDGEERSVHSGRVFRVIGVLAVAIVLAGGAAARLTTGEGGTSTYRAALTGTLFEGTIKPGQQFTIAAPVPTVVHRVLVRVGEHVDVDRPLLVLDDRDALAALRAAEVELRGAETRVDTVRGRLTLLEQTPADALVRASGQLSKVQREAEQVPTRQWRDSPERAAAAHDQARLRLDRVRKLHEQGLVSRQELEESEIALRVAANDLENARRAAAAGASLQRAQDEQSALQAQLARAEREQQRTSVRAELALAEVSRDEAAVRVEAARARLEGCTVRSTGRGVIVETLVRPGDQVAAGAPLVRLATLDALLVEVHVAPAFVNVLRVGQRAAIALPGSPDRQTRGDISAISPMPNAAGHHAVEIRFENPDAHLLAGQPAQVRFELTR